MKELIRKYFWKYETMSAIICFATRLKNYKAKKSMYQRQHLTPFDYMKNSEDIPLYPDDRIIDNNYYGLSQCLKKYMNSNKSIHSYIEHGLFIGSFVKKEEINSFVKSIITLSSYREHWIKQKSNKPVIKIGPYIHYANDYYSDQDIKQIKTKLGKVLLVFPAHSIKGINTKYDISNFINTINCYKQNYSTILICLYYKDVVNGIDKLYSTHGYQIVSAGHCLDPLFLPRLKSLIKLSDLTISNSIGTHIGYCVYLKKKHIVYLQDIELSSQNKNLISLEINQRNDHDKFTLEIDKKKIYETFKNAECDFDNQIAICNYYWGFDNIMSPEELRVRLHEANL